MNIDIKELVRPHSTLDSTPSKIPYEYLHHFQAQTDRIIEKLVQNRINSEKGGFRCIHKN